MIIQCDQCQTKFKLPDEKLKPGGVKVRCSHCKHVFTVMPPETPQETAAEPVKEEAPAPTPAPSPEAQGGQESSSSAGEDESAEADSGMSGFDFGDFDETPDEGDFAAGTTEAAGESSELDFSSAFDEDESAFSEEPSEQTEDSSFGFGGTETKDKDDLGFGGEETSDEESAGPTEFEFDEQASPEDFGFDADAIGDEFEFDEGEEEGAGDEFDFGDAGTEPDAFDFGDEDPFAEEDSAAAEAGGEEKEFKFTELPAAGEDDSSRAAAPGGSFAPSAPESQMSETGYFEEEPFPEKAPAAPPATAGKGRKKAKKKEGKRKGSPLSRVLLLVFLLLVVLLGGVGYLYWQQGEVGLPVVDDLISRLTDTGGVATTKGSLEIAEQSGRYVTNRLAGTLLVIEGRAVNGYPSSRANLRVQAVLYDAGGRALRKQNAYCGNRLTDEQLRTLPFAKIEESMNNAFGEALSNIDVPPGKGLPFTVVFRDLPENLDSFSVDGLDSQPASAQ